MGMWKPFSILFGATQMSFYGKYYYYSPQTMYFQLLGRPLLGRPLLGHPLLGRPLLGRPLLGHRSSSRVGFPTSVYIYTYIYISLVTGLTKILENSDFGFFRPLIVSRSPFHADHFGINGIEIRELVKTQSIGCSDTIRIWSYLRSVPKSYKISVFCIH